MPNSFKESSSQMLYIASGIDAVLRWDGRTAQAETAGVAGPVTTSGSEEQPALTGSGSGAIVGAYRAYVRYVDRLGNVSNLSAVSEAYETNATTGSVINATNAVPIVITSASHGLSTGDVVKLSEVSGNTAANGTFKIATIDGNSFSLQTNDTDETNVAGNAAYEGGGTWVRGVSSISYSAIPIPADPKVVRRQVLRNTDGQAFVYYVDIDTYDLSSNKLQSNKTDNDLLAQATVSLFDADWADLAVSRYSVPPSDRAFLQHVLGRLFMAGIEPYEQGRVSIAFGATTVTGLGTEWTAELEGRYLNVLDADRSYEIDSVDVSAQTLTLTESYEDDSSSGAKYKIRPADATSHQVSFSEAGLVESFPPTNAITLDHANQQNEITGLMDLGSFLYILQERRIDRLTFQASPLTDGFTFEAAQRGCANNRCWVLVDGQAYLLDERGAYRFTGNEIQPLSQPIQNMFEAETAGHPKINWRWRRFFHAAHSFGQQIIRWFVALDGSKYPYHAICYDYKDQAWWIEEYPIPICSSVAGEIDSQATVFVGSTAGRILALESNELDGPDAASGTTTGTVTSSDLMWIADSAATFPASNVVGYPVSIVSGTGKNQQRIVTEVNGTTLKVNQPWLTKPDTTSVYQLGGIKWRWKSGTFRYARVPNENVRRVETISRPTDNACSLDVRIYEDRTSTPTNWGVDANNEGVSTESQSPDAVLDLTRESGHHQFRFDGLRSGTMDGSRHVSIEARGIKRSDPVGIYEMAIDGVESRRG